jgi:hypothetical protein
MAAGPAALRLRQTVVEVAAEKNSTLVMPVPVELLRFIDRPSGPPALRICPETGRQVPGGVLVRIRGGFGQALGGLQAAGEGVEAGREALVAVVGPGVLAEDCQGRESVCGQGAEERVHLPPGRAVAQPLLGGRREVG